jgi:hypothetical protein
VDVVAVVVLRASPFELPLQLYTLKVRKQLASVSGQTDKQADRQTDRERDRQRNRQTDRETGRQADRQTDNVSQETDARLGALI